jgi:hypothetical protein
MNYGYEQHGIREAAMQAGKLTTGYAQQDAGQDSKLGDNRAIPQAFNNLEKDLHALGEVVNVLNNRIKPISHPEGTAVGEQQAKQAMPDVPMVNAISLADGMVRSVLRNLNDILQRLEI